jgi:hypothetical protein
MVKLPVVAVAEITVSVKVGVVFFLLKTIPLAVIVDPPLLVITPPAVALVAVMFVSDEVVTVGALGDDLSFLQAVTRAVATTRVVSIFFICLSFS